MSASESCLIVCRELRGGDWSESACRPLLRGGDWSESARGRLGDDTSQPCAPGARCLLGGEGSESESCLAVRGAGREEEG